jgi:hypothetical protein
VSAYTVFQAPETGPDKDSTMMENTMKMILPLAAALAFATPAFASQCPGDMTKIDAALQTASLSEAELAEVTALRATGEQQHASGDHAGSIETLAKAKKILEIE